MRKRGSRRHHPWRRKWFFVDKIADKKYKVIEFGDSHLSITHRPYRAKYFFSANTITIRNGHRKMSYSLKEASNLANKYYLGATLADSELIAARMLLAIQYIAQTLQPKQP